MRKLAAEIRKTKNRYVWALFPLLLLLHFVWLCWIMRGGKPSELTDGYYMLLMNIPMINTITTPILLAVLASRLCDVENKGNTYKLLCTMENKGSIFDSKFILGLLYLLVFTILQTAMALLLGKLFGITQAVPWSRMGLFAVSSFLTGASIFLIQECLSLMLDNQLYPLFIGLIGTFVGLFSWFFPSLPLRNLIPWGYYCVGVTVNFNYYEDIRVQEFYPVDFEWTWFVALAAFSAVVYILGRRAFVKKEV